MLIIKYSDNLIEIDNLANNGKETCQPINKDMNYTSKSKHPKN